MSPKKILSFILAVTLTAGFILPTSTAKAFEQFPRSLAWELVSQSGVKKYNSEGYPYAVHYAQAGETVQMQVTVRNMSRNRRAEMWYGRNDLLPEGPNYPNAHAIGLGTWDPMDHIPSFLDPSSFVINGNRLAYYDGSPVNRGQTMTMNFQVKLKDNLPDGTYDLVLSLVREFDEWGWRDNGYGQNHRYRSMLWKFVVGNNQLSSSSEYSISNNYLVKGSTKLINYNLTDYLATDRNTGELIRPIPKIDPGDPVQEWLRFEKDGQLYIYVVRMMGCGGCAWTDYYFEIDLYTDEVSLGISRDTSSFYLFGVPSPDKTKVAYLKLDEISDWENSPQSVLVYDLATHQETLLKNLPNDATMLSIGDGWYLDKRTLSWEGNDTVLIQPFEKISGQYVYDTRYWNEWTLHLSDFL